MVKAKNTKKTLPKAELPVKAVPAVVSLFFIPTFSFDFDCIQLIITCINFIVLQSKFRNSQPVIENVSTT